MTLASVMVQAIQAFTDAGVRATDDPRDANPPCAVVAWPTGEFLTGKGRVHLTMTAYLLVGDGGARNAMVAMSEVFGRVAGRLGSVTTFAPAGFQIPGGGDPLPAYQLTWQTTTTP
jgi:hypothetical protein